MIKAIIFDLDGVLVFTDQFHYRAWKRLADRLGIYFDEKINDRLRGISRMKSLQIILEGKKNFQEFDEKQKTELAEEKNVLYRSFLQELTPEHVEETVRSTLWELKRRGYSLAVGSSSKNAKMILEQTGLIEIFDAISDGNNIEHSKPDPEVFLKAAAMLGVLPEECAVVEDAPAGIEAAKAGCMQAIGIGTATCYEKTDFTINQISELLEIFQ